VLVDVGSTVLKGASIDGQQTLRSFYHVRQHDAPVAKQVEAFVEDVADRDTADIRICSSANGGLRVGIVCLTRRFSGAAAAHSLAIVGANVVYIRELRELAHSGTITAGAPPVDVLVLVGGVDAFDNERAVAAFLDADLSALSYDRIMFAGHRAAAERLSQHHPDLEIVSNLMHQRLNAEDGALADRIRLTYLDDITSKKELNALTSYSLRLIEPTPAVVSRAFSRIFTRLSSPALLLDIGGATTDVHFTKELLDEERISGTLTNYPAVARYVYTGFGVFASRSSTLQAFVHHPRCIDFLAGLYGDASREIYLDLLDGKASDRLLFEACILLALCGASALDSDDHARMPEEPPPLLLNRLATLAITGGGAKVLDESIVRRAFALVAGPEIPVTVLIDHGYCWWTLGLLDEQQITPQIWKSANV